MRLAVTLACCCWCWLTAFSLHERRLDRNLLSAETKALIEAAAPDGCTYVAVTHKRIVMNCPEMGTLNSDGSGPYDQPVMEKVAELQQIGYLKYGFDRLDSSTFHPDDKALKDEASAQLALGNRGNFEKLFKEMRWWHAWSIVVKQTIKLECQGFDGVLDIVDIHGGPISQLQSDALRMSIEEAIYDCVKFGINTTVKYTLTQIQYGTFLAEYEPSNHYMEWEPNLRSPSPSLKLKQQRQMSPSGRFMRVVQEAMLVEDYRAQLRAKDEELAANATELAQLRAQLARLEGVPPR